VTRWVPALLLGAVLVSHAPLLGAGYVQDDHVAIESGVPSGTRSILSASYWEGREGADRSLYRPVTVASYALERAILGRPVPSASHAINLILHAAVCWAIYAIAVRSGVAGSASLLGALLFAVWPAKSEAVANVVGRAEILAALFTLVAVRLALARGSRMAAWGAGASVLLACGSKETGLAALPLVALAAWGMDGPGRRLRDAVGMVLPACLAFVVFTILRTRALEAFFPFQTVPVMDNPLVAEHGVRALATALALVARYAGIAMFPWGLANDYSGASIAIEPSLLAWRPIAGAVLLLAPLAIARRSPRAALFAAVAALPYLLIGNLVVPVGAILAERFLYLPLAGVCLLSSLLVERWGRPAARLAWAVTAVWAVLMVARAVDWRTDATIFAATARHNPKSPRAPYWLGSIAVEEGRTDEATPLYDAAIRNWPAFAPAWHDRGLLLARRGDYVGATRALEESIRLEPSWGTPYLNLALVLHRSGDRAAALKSARKAALWSPRDAKAWAELGHLRFETGDFRGASEAYRRAVALGRIDLAPRLAEAQGRS